MHAWTKYCDVHCIYIFCFLLLFTSFILFDEFDNIMGGHKINYNNEFYIVVLWYPRNLSTNKCKAHVWITNLINCDLRMVDKDLVYDSVTRNFFISSVFFSTIQILILYKRNGRWVAHVVDMHPCCKILLAPRKPKPSYQVTLVVNVIISEGLNKTGQRKR